MTVFSTPKGTVNFLILNHKMIEYTQLRNWPCSKEIMGEGGDRFAIVKFECNQDVTSPNLIPLSSWGWSCLEEIRGTRAVIQLPELMFHRLTMAEWFPLIKHIFNYPLGTYSLLEFTLQNKEPKALHGSHKIVQVSYCMCICLIILSLPSVFMKWPHCVLDVTMVNANSSLEKTRLVCWVLAQPACDFIPLEGARGQLRI